MQRNQLHKLHKILVKDCPPFQHFLVKVQKSQVFLCVEKLVGLTCRLQALVPLIGEHKVRINGNVSPFAASKQLPMHVLQISSEIGETCAFGDHTVSVVPHMPLRLLDGTRLSLKFWFPSESLPADSIPAQSFVQYEPSPNRQASGAKRFPVILEHLPYRKSDFTLDRDHRRHTWMCSHGYVVVRSDMRGSGDSEGHYYDEYEETELSDACEIIQWCAEQAWCNGRVGQSVLFA